MASKRKADQQAFRNAVKTLAANIRFASVDDPVRVICVTSSVPSEGKTTTSAALGRALAEGGASVLLVECDMRRRSLAAALGCHGAHGLYSVLAGDLSAAEAAMPVKGHDGLFLLDAEPGIPNPVDLLQSKRFSAMLSQLRRRYDYVLLDTPPVSVFVDGAVVASQADATILVARQGITRRDDAAASYAQLAQAGAKVIGTVLNGCDASSSGHYYGYYAKRREGGRAHLAPAGGQDLPVPPAPAHSMPAPKAGSTGEMLAAAGYGPGDGR